MMKLLPPPLTTNIDYDWLWMSSCSILYSILYLVLTWDMQDAYDANPALFFMYALALGLNSIKKIDTAQKYAQYHWVHLVIEAACIGVLVFA